MARIIPFPLINDYTLDLQYQNYYSDENYFSVEDECYEQQQQINNRTFLQKLIVKLINRLYLYI